MSKYVGDLTPGKTVRLRFNSHKADGTPITLAGTPAISVYKGSTTESTAGVTLTVDYDNRTGLHDVVIDTSADGTFYAAGNDFTAVLTAGTVDSVSVVGTVVGSFSLSNRSGLRPTVADRTLDVAATGEAGLDFDNIHDASGAHTLTNIVVPLVTLVTTTTTLTNLPAITAGWLTATGIAANALNGKGDWMVTYTQPTGFLAATFPGGTVANTTNITAGTITTATNVTTVNGLAAGVITTASIAAGAITDAKFTLPAEAAGTPSTFMGLIQWIATMLGWRKVVKDSGAGTITAYLADGSTVKTVSAYTSSGGVDTINKAS